MLLYEVLLFLQDLRQKIEVNESFPFSPLHYKLLYSYIVHWGYSVPIKLVVYWLP